MPGASLAMQIAAPARRHFVSLAALAGVAQLLAHPEFGEARDLVIGRLRRMNG